VKVTRKFSKTVLATLQSAKILGLRVDNQHRFIGVWPIVVQDRLFIRSWDNKPNGWYQAFQKESTGAIQVGERKIKICSRRVNSERLLDAVDQAYRDKYPTPGSRNYVFGFAQPKRRATTTELVPK
jgi:hypothetical protein